MKIVIAILTCALWIFLAEIPESLAQTQPPGGNEDPFGQSQLAEIKDAGKPSWGLSGFVDAGFINITQTGPLVDGGDLSWAYGNSQFTYFSQASTFAVNEVDLTLFGETTSGSLLLGGRFSIDYYPSRDSESYTIPGSEREFSVDEAFVFLEFLEAWNTRVVLGRAPGFVTLEQQQADSPDLILVGHTYVFQAGGGYPYGLQVITRPGKSLAIKLGFANGGVGDYSFFPGDDSTLNRPTARDADNNSASDKADKLTFHGAVEWVPLDNPAGAGTLKLGLAAAENSALTFNPATGEAEPYSFSNVYASYAGQGWQIRSEIASLEAFYELSLGKFEASMLYLLFSFDLTQTQLLTLRLERIDYKSDRGPNVEGQGTKNGVTWRVRLAEPMVIKVEAVREVQSPQFFVPTRNEELTTDVFTTSWVYSF